MKYRGTARVSEVYGALALVAALIMPRRAVRQLFDEFEATMRLIVIVGPAITARDEQGARRFWEMDSVAREAMWSAMTIGQKVWVAGLRPGIKP